MKKRFNWLAVVLAMALVITASCKKDDDDDNGQKNHLKYDGTEYNLGQGFLENYGLVDESIYNLDLILLSSSITIYETQGEIDSASGSGAIIYFEMYTSSATVLEAGTYQYDESSMDAMSFDYADFALDFDVETEEGEWIEITAGTVTVSKDGNTYTITFDCTAEGGKKVTGSFKGTLKYYDWDDKKSGLSKKHFFK